MSQLQDVHTQTLATPAVQPPLGVRITVLDARAAPQTYRLSRGTCVVGAAAGSDIVVEDRGVSRSHLELSVVRGGIVVQDLGSRNGTYYSGQRVDRITLAHGASVTVGNARLLLDADTEALAEATYDGDQLGEMIGTSSAIRRVFAVLSRLQGSAVNVLVNGESGTGKELVARALHEGSGVEGRLVCFNCGAVPRELVTSELFGHRRGAFTGATEGRRGAFETADRGTLFLDEIGELPLEAQPALLRALESGEVRPVGADQPLHVNVRVIAATHRDLERDVREGRFREDLYYRLAVIKLQLPPLRERVEDIPLLARRFARAAGLAEIPAPVLEELKQRPWPGNARELRNVMQAYAVLGHVPAAVRPPPASVDSSLAGLVDVTKPYAELKDEVLERFQRVYLAELLEHVGGNRMAAAKLAGMDRTYLGRLLSRYGLGQTSCPPPVPSRDPTRAGNV